MPDNLFNLKRPSGRKKLPPRALVEAFSPKGDPARTDPRGLRAKAAIASTAAAAQQISREQGVSFEEAGAILRQTFTNLKRTRAAFRGMASGLTKRGATEPITSAEAFQSLTRPNVLRGVQGREDLARFVVDEEARRPTTNIRVFRTEALRQRSLLGIRR